MVITSADLTMFWVAQRPGSRVETVLSLGLRATRHVPNIPRLSRSEPGVPADPDQTGGLCSNQPEVFGLERYIAGPPWQGR